MDKKELKDQVSVLVASLFDEKEEAEIRKQTQQELEKSATAISDLTSALESKTAECSSVVEELEISNERVVELESKLEAAKKELETANAKLNETEIALEEIRKDGAAEKRMVELEEAGVARSDREDQLSKVREMSDEVFASYKEELVSVREAVVAELEKARKQAEDEAKAKDEAAKTSKKENMPDEEDEEDEEMTDKKKKGKKKEKCSVEDSGTSEEAASEEEEEDTMPANITPGQAAMASLNMEYIPSDSVKAKYAELGKALAARFNKKS